MNKGILSFEFIEKNGELKLMKSYIDKNGEHKERSVCKLPTEAWGKLKSAFFDYYRLKIKRGEERL